MERESKSFRHMTTEELAERVKELKARQEELQVVAQQLVDANNEISFRNAAAFLVVEADLHEAVVLGAALASHTRYMDLVIKYDAHDFGGVRVVAEVAVSSVRVFLKMGEHVKFYTDRSHDGLCIMQYEIWVFDNLDSATLLAKKLLAEHK